MKKKQTFYRVTLIRSKRANEREGYEYPNVEKAWDFKTFAQAKVAYDELHIGVETEKEIYKVIVLTDAFGSEELELIETTY